MLYLYAIAAEPGDIAELRGIQDEPLVRFSFRDALVIAGEVRSLPALDAQNLKAQDALVRTLHDRSAALLPMRFGMTIPEVAAIHSALAYAGIEKKLPEVRGREQMTLRVVGLSAVARAASPRAEADAGGTSGTAYLRARVQRYRASEQLTQLATAGSGFVHDVRVEPANQHDVHGSVYHLIDRGRAAGYRAAVEEVARTMADVRVTITGPSPAYAFA